MRFTTLSAVTQVALTTWYYQHAGMEGFRCYTEGVLLEEAGQTLENPIAAGLFNHIDPTESEEEALQALAEVGRSLVEAADFAADLLKNGGEILTETPDTSVEGPGAPAAPVRAVTWGHRDETFVILEQQDRAEYVAMGLRGPAGDYKLTIVVGTGCVTTNLMAASGKPGIEKLALWAVSEKRDGTRG